MQLRGSAHQAEQPARTIHASLGSFWNSSRAPVSQEKHKLQVVDCAANLLWQLCCWDLGFPVCPVGAFAWEQCGSLMMNCFPGMGQHKAFCCLHKIHLICYLLRMEPYSEHRSLLLLIDKSKPKLRAQSLGILLTILLTYFHFSAVSYPLHTFSRFCFKCSPLRVSAECYNLHTLTIPEQFAKEVMAACTAHLAFS